MTLEQIQKILNDPSPILTENLAQQAHRLTRQYFGRAIALYTPLYLSNYCTGGCVYCGFNRHQNLKREKLSFDQIHAEMQSIAATGIENILLLTGESYDVTPLPYLIEAIKLSRQYFSSVGLEIHPLSAEEYSQLYLSGADSVTIYQETYDRNRYAEVHRAGRKQDYDFRRAAPHRIAQAGFRQISLGILLGLGDAASDLFALYEHLKEMEQSFPGVEYSLSFPRLRPIQCQDFVFSTVDDATFLRTICLSRILFPRVSINLSTRENQTMRDHLLGLGVTRVSAGSRTTVGGYTEYTDEHLDPQFEIQDHRSVDEMIRQLKALGFDPVLTDWRAIQNETTH